MGVLVGADARERRRGAQAAVRLERRLLGRGGGRRREELVVVAEDAQLKVPQGRPGSEAETVA